MLILGIETSCDETAASVVRNGTRILSNVISSSLTYHKRFGGVVPEIATRHHTENIDRVIKKALSESCYSVKDIDAVSVTEGPGLPGALLVGIACAKAIAYSLNIPLIAIDHLRSHIYSALMRKERMFFPFIGLVISGGHTRLFIVRDFDSYEILGDAIDDAIGEAYDKVAKILGLGYPGGPLIDRLAKKGNQRAIRFTCKPMEHSFNVSFSGIKTAVLYHVRGRGCPSTLPLDKLGTLLVSARGGASRVKGGGDKADVAASFQETVLNVIIKNSIKAMEKYSIKTLVVGGGVSANSRFREKIALEAKIKNFNVYYPPLNLCSDNAAMVAGLGYWLYKKGHRAKFDITALN